MYNLLRLSNPPSSVQLTTSSQLLPLNHLSSLSSSSPHCVPSNPPLPYLPTRQFSSTIPPHTAVAVVIVITLEISEPSLTSIHPPFPPSTIHTSLQRFLHSCQPLHCTIFSSPLNIYHLPSPSICCSLTHTHLPSTYSPATLDPS
jgi:hypothetical protein